MQACTWRGVVILPLPFYHRKVVVYMMLDFLWLETCVCVPLSRCLFPSLLLLLCCCVLLDVVAVVRGAAPRRSAVWLGARWFWGVKQTKERSVPVHVD